MHKGQSSTETEGIRVSVGARYLPEQSDPDRSQHVYSYHVVIRNEGDQPAQLVSRHWIVLDAIGERREVRGPGVVGAQPNIAPGESFEYTSGCRLTTEWGSMEGSYKMQRPDGSSFDAQIGRFFLAPSLSKLEGSPARE